MATAVGKSVFTGLCGEPAAWPTAQSLEDAMRTVRRAATDARCATEDFVAGTSLEVRRHPLAAIGLAASGGVIAGSLVGFAAAWYAAKRT